MQKQLSDILRNEINDPRISDNMISIIETKVTNDLSFADIYITVLGDDKKREEVLDALNQAKGYIKNLIGDKMRLRQMPEFRFKMDKSIEHGIYMDQLIKKTIEKDKRNHVDDYED